MEQQYDRFELNMVELVLYLKKKLLYIVAVTVLFALGGYLHGTFFVEPVYTAETRMYVLNRTNSSVVVSSDFQTSSYLLKDYQVLITGQNVTQEVVDRLSLNMSAKALSNKIEVTSPNNTRVLQISYSDPDPQLAAAVANAVREEAALQLKSIMEVDAVHLVYAADVPRTPSSAQTTHKVTFAATIGLVLSLVVFVVIFVMDDTIRNEEDVTHYLGLNVIGVIPASSDMSVSREDGEGKMRRRLPRKKRMTRK